jgi:hypothetical protein
MELEGSRTQRYKLFIRASFRRPAPSAVKQPFQPDILAARIMPRVSEGSQMTYDWIGSRGGNLPKPIEEN